MRPVIGSGDRPEAGNTYHHFNSKGARGYFRTSDSGIDTSPKPAARSEVNMHCEARICYWRPGANAAGSGTHLSFAPVASWTAIC